MTVEVTRLVEVPVTNTPTPVLETATPAADAHPHQGPLGHAGMGTAAGGSGWTPGNDRDRLLLWAG